MCDVDVKRFGQATASALLVLLMVAPGATADGVGFASFNYQAMCGYEAGTPRASVEGHCAPTSGGDGVTLATYVDSQTGNTARLAVQNNALVCEWDAPYAGIAPLVAAHYFAVCAIEVQGNGVVFTCGSDSAAFSGGPSGQCQLLDYLPSVDVKWSIVVKAVEVVYHVETEVTSSTEKVDKWYVDLGYSTSASLKLHFIGKVPVPTIGLEGGWTGNGGYGVTTTRTVEVSERTTIDWRRAVTLGVSNWHVSLEPRITTLEWTSGRGWGCDALDMIEAVAGARQIGEYSIQYASQGVTDSEVIIDFGNSVPHAITDQGDFERAVYSKHQIEANAPMRNYFTSSLDFEVDYEMPDLHEAGADFVLSTVNEEVHIYVQVGPSGWDYIVTNSTVPFDDLASTAGFLPYDVVNATTSPLQALADQIGVGPLDAEPDGHPYCTTALTEEEQTWTATGTAAGIGTETVKSTSFDVDVYLEWLWK